MDRKQYLLLLEPAIATVVAKHEDYNVAAPLASYFPFADKSYTQMIHVKSSRLVSLASSDAEPNFESVEDTLLDMINYCVFYLAYLQSLKPAPRGGRK
jgi:hypothetical protein